MNMVIRPDLVSFLTSAPCSRTLINKIYERFNSDRTDRGRTAQSLENIRSRHPHCGQFPGRHPGHWRVPGPAGRPQRAGSHDLHDHPLHHFRRAFHLPGAHRLGRGAQRRATRRTCCWPSTSIPTRTTSARSRRGASCFTIPTMWSPSRNGRPQYHHVGVPISSLTIEAIGGTAKDKGKNIFALGLVARMFDLNVAEAGSADRRAVWRQRRRAC